MELLDLERRYCKILRRQYTQLKRLFTKLESDYTFDLRKRDISKTILLRMMAYSQTHYKIKGLLDKRLVPAASDFFVETVTFYLKLFLKSRSRAVEVHSERKIQRTRGAIKPDISVWQGDEVIAIIECKTQLGWNRNDWQRDFNKREKKLKRLFPNAKAFLVVMCSENWAGFDAEIKGVGQRFFCLSSEWPRHITDETLDKVIENPIEGLLRELLAFCK